MTEERVVVTVKEEAHCGQGGYDEHTAHAFRNPNKNEAIVQMLIILWGLLALVHVYTLAAGIEEWNNGLRLLVMDAIMTAGLVYFYIRAHRSPQP
jgi:K+-transporting ATPase A subunit